MRMSRVGLQYTVQVDCIQLDYKTMDTTPTRHLLNAVLMLDQRLRCWPNIKITLVEWIMFAGKAILSIHVGVSCFELPTVIQSVSFQTQRPAKSIGGIITS